MHTTTTQPAKRPTRVATRTRQLRTIHELARALDLETREGEDRSAYEAELTKVCGRTSSRQATRPEREAIIRHPEAKLAAKRTAPVMTQEQFDAEEDELIAMLGGF